MIHYIPPHLWPTTTTDTWIEDGYKAGLVSVIIPTHNRRQMLVKALESAFGQTYRPVEVIVVDDGSTDGTENSIADWTAGRSENGFRVCYQYQDNRGARCARNTGSSLARGEYIQYLDSDDELTRDKLSQHVQFLRARPEVDVVYGDSTTGRDTAGARFVRGISNAGDMVVTLLGRQFNPNFAYLCRRRAVAAIGPWDPGLICLDDWDYFLRMAIAGACFQYEAGETGLYRRHPGPCISRIGGQPSIRNCFRILERAEAWMNALNCWSQERREALSAPLSRHWLPLAQVGFVSFPLSHGTSETSISGCSPAPSDKAPAYSCSRSRRESAAIRYRTLCVRPSNRPLIQRGFVC